MPDDIAQAISQSVQNLPEVNKSNGASSVGFWLPVTGRGDILPAWGSYERKRLLRMYERAVFNNLYQGAENSVINKFANTPSQLKGGRNLTARFDNVLRFSQFFKGQKQLKKLFARDYLRYDDGAYIEIIAPGNPLKDPTGGVTSLAVLDSMHCFPTGDPEFPVVFYNTEAGKKPSLNVLHHARVMHLYDMPDSDQQQPDRGLCALSRAMAIVQREIDMGHYISANLDDKPQAGIVLATGMNKTTWETAWNNFRNQQSTDLLPEWGRNLPIFGMDPALPPKLEMFTFANPPEKFDFKVYVELDVHELALALGIDIQDIWENTSAGLGSAGQSEIQHAKARGNTLGDMLTTWELSMNNYVLPEALEYEHKVRDPYEANERATNAQIWAGFLQSAGDSLTTEEKRQILANQVEAVADAIIDDAGDIIRLDDIDPVAQDQQQRIVEDSAPNNPEAAAGEIPQESELTKDFAATRAGFESDVAALLNSAQDDDVNRRRFGIILRDNIRKYGDKAYRDGLEAGGVSDDLSADDRATYAVLLAEQSAYVTRLGTALYADGAQVSDAAQRSAMWFNKSIVPFYQAGLASADANGIYQWVLGYAEHCASCRAMSGQKHRLKEYMNKGILPQSSELECKGFNCACGLQKSSGKTKGNWLG